jgi:hypothetical protein
VSPTASPTETGTPPPTDAVCAEAVELARAAVADDAPAGTVGEHLGVEAEDDRVVTHYFAATDPAYVGWRWAVTVARASEATEPTVDEVVLLPGDGALLAPAWVPWQERLRPGDLGVGDILPTRVDDDRLVPAYAATNTELGSDVPADLDEPDVADVVVSLGLGRERVLSRIGRDDAVDRWYSTDPGPQAPIAKAAPAPCSMCGFWLPLAGALRGVFGACANEFAPDDGRVVSADHGCGAHSEAMVVSGEIEATPMTPALEMLEEFEVVDATQAASSDESPAEDLGHS